MLIGGGSNTRTSEILLESGDTSPGFSLDYSTYYACSIEEAQTVTITGGFLSLTRVTRYQEDGSSQSLPNLNTGRRNHACGHYTTSANSIVYIVSGGRDQNWSRMASTETLEKDGGTEWQL